MLNTIQDALTFDDVLLVPAESSVLPDQTKLDTFFTAKIPLHIPFVSAAMDKVSEARMAITIAQEGGISVIHKNMSIEEQARQVRSVKRFEGGIVRDPLTVTADSSIRDLLNMLQANQFSGVPVTDQKNNLVGIITRRDIRFEQQLDQPVSTVMTPKERLITVREGAPREEVLSLLHKHRIERVLVVDDHFALRGMITVTDILKAKEHPQAAKDLQQRLVVAAAVGTSKAEQERIMALIQAGVDAIVIDTAHGHSEGVINQVQWIKKNYPDTQIIAGNIVTAKAAHALVQAGADAVKVGIGPGSICTTRIVTGVGVPQITAIAEVAAALKNTSVKLIADGGIRYSGDACKALAAGADSVMIGSLFAGCEESPGEIELHEGRSYKIYRGMGSLGAMAQGSKDRYFQSNVATEKLVPEGIEGMVPYKGSVVGILQQLTGGLRACLGYTGCADLEALHRSAEFMRISSAAMRESHVHDVRISKEAPNYWREC